MVRILGFHCHDPDSISGLGTEIPQAMGCGQKKKKLMHNVALSISRGTEMIILIKEITMDGERMFKMFGSK